MMCENHDFDRDRVEYREMTIKELADLYPYKFGEDYAGLGVRVMVPGMTMGMVLATVSQGGITRRYRLGLVHEWLGFAEGEDDVRTVGLSRLAADTPILGWSKNDEQRYAEDMDPEKYGYLVYMQWRRDKAQREAEQSKEAIREKEIADIQGALPKNVGAVVQYRGSLYVRVWRGFGPSKMHRSEGAWQSENTETRMGDREFAELFYEAGTPWRILSDGVATLTP